jgi:predicted DsbA family dithiol-disulfide isomerase
MAVIKIDIVSDVVCPWCYIGKRRLENALKSLPESIEVEFDYHPFELNPNAPQSGVKLKEHLIDKFGSEDHYTDQLNRVTEVARQEGLTFNLIDQVISPNTRKIHALIAAAKEYDVQKEMTEAFFKAYFTDSANLTEDKTILKIAETNGMTFDVADSIINDPAQINDIQTREKKFYSMGITGVPFFIMINKYGISGAQSSETFLKAIVDVSEEMSVA